MVAAAQGAGLADPAALELAQHFRNAAMALDEAQQALIERPRGARLARALHAAPVMLLEADRHGRLDGAAQARQVVGQLAGRQGRAHGVHAAADIDADGGRNNGAARGDHAADGGADAGMHVGHGGDKRMDERQAGDMLELAQRLRVDIVGKNVHGRTKAVQGVMNGHSLEPGMPVPCLPARLKNARQKNKTPASFLTGVRRNAGSGSMTPSSMHGASDCSNCC